MARVKRYPSLNLFRFALLWLSALILVIQTGCATPRSYDTALFNNPKPVLTIAERESLGTMVIVPARYAPDSNFVEFAEGPLTGAVKGGGLSLFSGIVAGGVVAVSSPAAVAFVAPVLIIELVALTATGAALGTAQGVKEAGTAEKKQKIKSAVANAVARLDAQQSLSRHLTSAVHKDGGVRLQVVEATGPANLDERPSYAYLQAASVDTVMEIAISNIGFEGCGGGFLQSVCPGGSKEPRVYLFMIGRARLVRVKGGEELYANGFRYDSPPRMFEQWAANDAQALAEELEQGYWDIAERINDELLLVTPLELPVPSYWLLPGSPLYLVCCLSPVDPAVEWKTLAQSLGDAFSQNRFHSSYGPLISPLKFTGVDSLTPTLRWSTFPRDIDREQLEPAILAKIRDVTYDLRVWTVAGVCRDKLVYETTGLKEPWHELENPLDPDQRYFWSFRARFNFDGQSMSTRWSALRAGSCNRNFIPNFSYYRFATPSLPLPAR